MKLGDMFLYDTQHNDVSVALAMVIGMVEDQDGVLVAVHLTTFSLDGVRVFHNVLCSDLLPVTEYSPEVQAVQAAQFIQTAPGIDEEGGEGGEGEEENADFGIVDSLKKAVDVVKTVGEVVDAADKTVGTVKGAVGKTVGGVKSVVGKFHKHNK